MSVLLISAPATAWTWTQNPTHNPNWYVDTSDLDAYAIISYKNLEPQQDHGIEIRDESMATYQERQYPDVDPPQYKLISIGQHTERWVWHSYYDLRINWTDDMPDDVQWVLLYVWITMQYWEPGWQQVDWMNDALYIMEVDPRVPDNANGITKNGQFHLWHAGHTYIPEDKYEVVITLLAEYEDNEGVHELYYDKVYIYYQMTV